MSVTKDYLQKPLDENDIREANKRVLDYYPLWNKPVIDIFPNFKWFIKITCGRCFNR